MNSDVNPIISEDYAELLIEYNGDDTVLQDFGDAPISRRRNMQAIVHIPVQELTADAVLRFGYGALPSLFGLVSHASLEASGIIRIRNIPRFDLRGQGVLIGIIDTGIEYTNPVFRNADGTTRIAAIWDQTIQNGIPSEEFPYGTVYTREQINQALQSENPYEIVPSRDEIGHGSMVAGIAGGTENPEADFSGVATNAEFVVVKLKQAKQVLRNFFFIPEQANCYQETDLLFAIDYVLNEAVQLQRPISICIAVNTSQAAHDGRGATSSYLSLIATRPNTCVVVAGGNEGNTRRHYYGTVNPTTGFDVVELNIGENERGFSMELWGQSPSIFSIDILSPSGEYVPRISVSLNDHREVTFVFEPTIIYLDFRIVESESGDQLILIRFENPVSGIWRFNVYERGNLNLGFHIWLPMGNFITENTFFIRSDPYTTVLALGNAEVPITITAYNMVDESLYTSASRGFTRLGRVTPDVAAPGVNINGPGLDQSFVLYTGTSPAAAHSCGVGALLLEWGDVRGNLNGISTIEIKKLMIRGARRDPEMDYPNRDWGFGILDVYNIFDSLRGGVVV
jgi:subtilisin family serine protease